MYSNFPFLPVNSVSAGKRTSVYGIGIIGDKYPSRIGGVDWANERGSYK